MKIKLLKTNPKTEIGNQNVRILNSALIHMIGLINGVITQKGAVINPLEEDTLEFVTGFEVYLDPEVSSEQTKQVQERYDKQLNLFIKMAEIDCIITITE